jgi:hypothetical protein
MAACSKPVRIKQDESFSTTDIDFFSEPPEPGNQIRITPVSGGNAELLCLKQTGMVRNNRGSNNFSLRHERSS